MFPGEHAATNPDKPAYIMANSGEVVTYRQLDDAANRLSQLFRAVGLQPGDHVAFCMENHPRYMEIVWGAQYAGLIYTACSSRLTSDELTYILDDCGAQVFITSMYKAEQAAEVAATTPDVKLRLMLDGTIDGYESFEYARRRVRRRAARRAHQRRRHALFVRHHREAKGRRAPLCRRAARHRGRRHQPRPLPLQHDARLRVPLAGTAVPRGTAPLRRRHACASAARR